MSFLLGAGGTISVFLLRQIILTLFCDLMERIVFRIVPLTDRKKAIITHFDQHVLGNAHTPKHPADCEDGECTQFKR